MSPVQELMVTGRYREALAAARDARACDWEAEPELLASAARLHRFMGDPAAGFEAAYRLLARARRDDDPRGMGLAYYLIAANVNAMAPSDSALTLLDRAEHELRPYGPSWELAATLLLRCEVLIDIGRRFDIPGTLARACAISHDLEDARLLAWALYLNAAIHPYEDALPTLLASLDLAQSFPCPELEWNIYRRIALKAREGGIWWLERDALVEARRILEEMAEPLTPAQRETFWSVPARREFMGAWNELPIASAGPTSDWDFLIEQRAESRKALPAYCRHDPA